MQRFYLPWPPQGTSPNKSRAGNWRGGADARRSYKDECGWMLIEQKAKPVLSVSTVEVFFHPPRNGRFDLDNLLARAKSGLDAVAEAIGVDDGDWPEMRLVRADKRPGGCVEVAVA